MQRVTLDCWPAKESLTFMEADEGTVKCRLYVELERQSADDAWLLCCVRFAEMVLWHDGISTGKDDCEPSDGRQNYIAAFHWWNKPHIQDRYAEQLQQAADEQWLRDCDANL